MILPALVTSCEFETPRSYDVQPPDCSTLASTGCDLCPDRCGWFCPATGQSFSYSRSIDDNSRLTQVKMGKTPLQLSSNPMQDPLSAENPSTSARHSRISFMKPRRKEPQLGEGDSTAASALLSSQAESPLLADNNADAPGRGVSGSKGKERKSSQRTSTTRLRSTSLQWPKRSGNHSTTSGKTSGNQSAQASAPKSGTIKRMSSWRNRKPVESAVEFVPSQVSSRLDCQPSISCIGSLHGVMSATHLPLLSSEAKERLEAMDASMKQSQLAVTIERSDELPFGAYSCPQVRVHIVDRCTGRALHPPRTTTTAAFCTTSSSVSNGDCTNTFEWQQTLSLPVDMVAFLSPRSVLLFEVIERKKTTKETCFRQGKWFQSVDNQDPDEDDDYKQQASPTSRSEALEPSSASTCRYIAWGFFHSITNRGEPTMNSFVLPRIPHTAPGKENQSQPKPEHKRPTTDSCGLRVRLFEYQMMTWMDRYQAKVQWGWRKNHPTVPAVFLQYQKRSRSTAPCTLHVELGAVRPIAPLQHVEGPVSAPVSEAVEHNAAIEASMPTESNQNNNENPPASASNQNESLLAQPEILESDPFDLFALCKRNTSEACLVPHRVLCSLPTGKKGCSAVSFSPCGRYLAAGVSPGIGEFVVRVHDVSSGDLFSVGRGHCGVIYSLEWDSRPSGQLRLLSASSDGTVRLWGLPSRAQGTVDSLADLQSPRTLSTPSRSQLLSLLFEWHHFPIPCFVYCAIFYPSSCGDIVITGASDGCLRFRKEASLQPDGHPVEYGTLHVSPAALHSICVEPKTGRIFCGDAKGDITVWGRTGNAGSTSPVPICGGYELIKTIRTGQTSITSLQLHPRKAHLLVHTQPDALFQYELRSYLLLNKSYAGVCCKSLLVKSKFSPDGKLVVSGSEDGIPRLFTSLHGHQVHRSVWGTQFFHDCPVLDVSWSPTAHMAALCSYGGNHPIVLLCAFRDDKDTVLQDSASSAKTAPQRQINGVVESASTPQVTNDEHAQRVQRALERRRQWLQTKLELEANANSELTNSTAV